MTQTFYDYLAIPAQCQLNKPLFKKMFQEHADLDVTDKKALKDDIDKIRWVYTLKPSTLNIAPYRDEAREYDEVAIIQINLTSANRTRRIAAFVHKAIPYPVMIVFSFADAIALSIADKRINQADKAKWVVEDEWLTEWFNPNKPTDPQKQFMVDMAIQKLPFINFYAFYEGIKNRILALNVASKTGGYSVATPQKSQQRRELLTQIAELEREVDELRSALKKETQFNKRLELNVAVKQAQQQIKELEKQFGQPT